MSVKWGGFKSRPVPTLYFYAAWYEKEPCVPVYYIRSQDLYIWKKKLQVNSGENPWLSYARCVDIENVTNVSTGFSTGTETIIYLYGNVQYVFTSFYAALLHKEQK